MKKRKGAGVSISQIVKIIQAALMGEIKVIERIEADEDSIFLKVDEKVYLITVQERMPVNVSVRTFHPQPKPEGKKKVK
jgi:hypothetical protein